MDYPGYVVTIGAPSAETDAIAARLAELGYRRPTGSIGYDGSFASLVKLYQSQHVDALGRPLKIDGDVGPLTWGSLFGAAPTIVAPRGLAGAALGHAVAQVGVREDPVGSNRGPIVDLYLASVGLAPGSYWCMAFVHWCFDQAAHDLARPNTFPRSGSCVDAWQRVSDAAPGCVISRAAALADPSLVRPGLVFILDFGGGHGHTGFVRQAAAGALRTVEGNSNDDGSDNGIGVFDLNRRTVTDPHLLGFLDFTA